MSTVVVLRFSSLAAALLVGVIGPREFVLLLLLLWDADDGGGNGGSCVDDDDSPTSCLVVLVSSSFFNPLDISSLLEANFHSSGRFRRNIFDIPIGIDWIVLVSVSSMAAFEVAAVAAEAAATIVVSVCSLVRLGGLF